MKSDKHVSFGLFSLNYLQLKTKVLSGLLYLTLALILVSFSDPYTIKRVSDADFRYEFYTTDKKITPKENKNYHWFKGGAIHQSQAGFAGQLLHDKFIKMYHNNQLAEQGKFKNGLRIGLWKTWHPNGLLETIQNWSNGVKKGNYFRYDQNGILAEKGNFKDDKKQGKWYDYSNKETLTYRRGELVNTKKHKLSKLEKFKINLEKTKAEKDRKELKESEESKEKAALEALKATAKENEKAIKEREKVAAEKEKASKKAERLENKKNGTATVSKIKTFFKSLFQKKQPKQK